MKSDNPYRSNEFCVNWEDNLLATSMGDAYEVGKQAGRKEVVKWFQPRLYGSLSEGYRLIQMTDVEWQAQLKEWGLKEVSHGM